MLRRIVARLQEGILARPGAVLLGSIVLTALGLLLGSGVEFRTSRSDLSPPDDPEQQRFARIAGSFEGHSDVIACLEAAPGAASDPEGLRSVADALAEAFRADPLVSQVFHRLDLAWFIDHSLWLAPPAALRRAVEAARGAGGVAETLASIPGLADLNLALAERIESQLASPGASPPAEGAAEALAPLTALLGAERRFLLDPEGVVSEVDSTPPLIVLAGNRPELTGRGYLATRDGRTLFLLVSPRSPDDSLPALRRLVGSLRERAAAVLGTHPGFHVAFTGEPATTVEEMEIVGRDTLKTSLVSAAGVVILTFLVFRWKPHALLVLTALGAGIAWSLGAVRLAPGYLNLITSSFISTLVGVGVAYGIHPVSEYELHGAHTVDPGEAVRRAYHATGAAVTVGAVTTSAAFFSILLMEFKGFAELGLVAGVGVLLCLVAALVTLPALIALYGSRRRRRDRAGHGGTATAFVDRLWVDRVAGRLCLFPRVTTVAALAVTALLAALALEVRFDTDLLGLLPRNAESVRYQERMIRESDLTPNFNVVVADDVAGLRELRNRAAAEPAIARFESALDLLPDDPEDARVAVAGAADLLDGIRLGESTRPVRRDALEGSLDRLARALAEASEAAFGGGFGEAAGALEAAREAADAARAAAQAAPEGAEARWSRGQESLLAWARRALDDLRRAARSGPPDPWSLPEETRARFVSSDGRLLAFLHPSGDVFDPPFLEAFSAASRRVSPEAAGFPLIFRSMSSRIVSGFRRAAVAAAVLVFLILLVDFRSLRDAALALAPLALGVVWMLGGMRLLGLSFNFANLVAVPLIIGVGIDNGVHVVHRVRMEGTEGIDLVLRHTGRAILIASFTTMIGFGALALASHRGIASLGTVLLLGVGACLVSATVVLPNLLVAIGLVRR